MKRSTLKFLAVLAIVSMVVMMGLPALAKGGKGKGKGQENRGGKKPVGTVTAYEPASNLLTATMKDGSTFSGTVAEDVQVKLDHRGNNGANKRKKPSNGDETNIVPNAEILKMKVKCDEVTKLRLRAATAQPLDVEPVVSEPAAEEPPAVRVMTEDEGTEEPEAEEVELEDDSDDCAEEIEEETDDSTDLDEDLDGELDEADETDDSGDDSTDDSGSDDGLDDLVDCVVTLLEDCA